MIPEFEHFILPTLNVLSNGSLLSLDEIRSAIIAHFGFTEEELNEPTRSGNNTKVNDRTTWALTYLRQAGLAESPKRAFAQITFAGLELLENPPAIITRDYLFQNYSSFRDFQNRSRAKKNKKETSKQKPFKTSQNKGGGTATRNLPLMQDLKALRSAIDSFRKLGIQPTKKQLEKLSELESKILQSIIAKDLSESLSENFNDISNEFVIRIKYSDQRILLYVDTSDEAITSFPDDYAVEISPKKVEKEDNTPKRKRRPNLNFFEMGLINGDKLIYKDDDLISVIVASENKVEYNGQIYSLTKLTQELKGLPHAIQPTGEWIFDGQNLLDLYNETYSPDNEQDLILE